MNTSLRFECYEFDQLSLRQLYRVMQLRQEVFVVEQDCPYLDCDDKDLESYHIYGVDSSDKIEAYTRLVPPGISYEGYSSIGRVVTSEAIRRQGQGVPLMQASINKCIELWPNHDIKISAQVYIRKFYESLGFAATGEEYLEDGIPHLAMVYKQS